MLVSSAGGGCRVEKLATARDQQRLVLAHHILDMRKVLGVWFRFSTHC